MPLPPFSHRLKKKDQAHVEKMGETFSRVKINIPLLDAIQQMPPYARFLKDLCTTREPLFVSKKAFLASGASSILSYQIPVKYKDPGCPTISIVIGDQLIHRALLNLGASVNLIPFTEYEGLGFGELKLIKMVIQLTGRSTRLPRGIVEDVLIRVDEFIYPVDFVVIETKKVLNLASQVPVILGHPFLATAIELINCRNEMMRLSFGNMTIELNIFNMQRQPSGFNDMELSTLNWVKDSVFDDAFDEMFATEYEFFLVNDELEYDVFEFDDLCSTADCLLTVVSESMHESASALALELKPLPDSLKYAFLGSDESLPITVASDLGRDQEDKLIALVRENKEAIDWTL